MRTQSALTGAPPSLPLPVGEGWGEGNSEPCRLHPLRSLSPWERVGERATPSLRLPRQILRRLWVS
ncbi:hypothetical protein [Neisseria sp.]